MNYGETGPATAMAMPPGSRESTELHASRGAVGARMTHGRAHTLGYPNEA